MVSGPFDLAGGPGQLLTGAASSSPNLTRASAATGLVSSLLKSVQIPLASAVFPAAM